MKSLSVGALVGAYLVAITAANLLAVRFADEGHPEWTVYTAFGLVAFDLVSRDRLHDAFGRYRWLALAVLIGAGSLISYAINRDAATATIALASCVAFASALSADSIVYELGRRANGTSMAWFRDAHLRRFLFHAAAPRQEILKLVPDG